MERLFNQQMNKLNEMKKKMLKVNTHSVSTKIVYYFL